MSRVPFNVGDVASCRTGRVNHIRAVLQRVVEDGLEVFD